MYMGKVAAALHEMKAMKVKVRDHKVCSTSTACTFDFANGFLNIGVLISIKKGNGHSPLVAFIEKKTSYGWIVALLWPDFSLVNQNSSMNFNKAMFSCSS